MQGGNGRKQSSVARILLQLIDPSDEQNYVYAWHHVSHSQHCYVWLFPSTEIVK